MKRTITVILLLIVSFLIHSYTSNIPESSPVERGQSQPPEDILYDVTSVTDGDTVVVRINGTKERVRLIGIDTPEVDASKGVVECYGAEASDKTKALLSGARVRVETDTTQGERDTYGRLLGYVFLEDGTNVNQVLLQEGFAKEFTYNKTYKYQNEFRQAEAEARLE